jgi:hypothetical protein
MKVIIVILKIILILSFICKLFLHIKLGKKYGKEFSYGFFTSPELFLFYMGEVKPEDLWRKKLIRLFWQIFILTLFAMFSLKILFSLS